MLIMKVMMELFDRIVDKNLALCRINVTACKLIDESQAQNKQQFEQLDLFDEFERLVLMRDGMKIPIEDIFEIDGDLFNPLETN